MKNRNILFSILCTVAAILACSGADQLNLVEKGKSDYKIVISETATEAEHHAAKELQHYVLAISGATLPIITDHDPLAKQEIMIGQNNHARQLGLHLDWDKLGEDGFHLVTHGKHLVLAANNGRGSLYAVYGFLEEVLGCRWYTPEASFIPTKHSIAIANLDLERIPSLEFRAVGWRPALDPDWAARNQVNSGSPLQASHGGQLNISGGGHSFYSLLPPDRYFEKHPEYYAEIDSRRTIRKAQLCLTNADVVALVTEAVEKRLAADSAIKIIAVGQEDWAGWCQCKECKAIADREESQAGPLIHFVNQVAERVEKKHPLVSISTLAYQDTRKPPKYIKAKHNVIVVLCGIECCYSHPIETCTLNRSFKQDVEGWARQADRLYIWDYTANFEHYIMPQPNLFVQKKNIEFFIRNHVRGIYGSGNTSIGAEMAELRGYLLAKLYWQPWLNERDLVQEFLAGFYGKAAPALLRYIDLMHDKVEKDQIHVFIASGPMMPHLQPTVMAEAKKWFDEAERLADNETIRKRVQVARLPIQHVELEWAKPSYRVRDGRYHADLIPGAEELAAKFLQVAEENNVGPICEFENRTPAWHLQQQAFWKKSYEAVTLENALLHMDVVPELGGRIVSVRYKPAERELLLAPQADGREYPWSGGYEEYSERGGRSAGWHEPYSYRVDLSGRKVTLTAPLPNGLQLERTVSLADERARITIDSRLTNISKTTKMGCLRVHPIFTLGPTQQVTVSYQTASGENRSFPLILPPGLLRDKVIATAMDKPNGRIQAVNDSLNLSITQLFDAQQIAEVQIDWLPSRERFFFELSSPEVTLSPGQSIRFVHEYDIQPVR